MGLIECFSRFWFGNDDQSWAQYAVGDQIALLQDGDHCIRLLFCVDHADRLMKMRVELLANRIKLCQVRFFESGNQLLERQLGAGFHAFDGWCFGAKRRFKAILDGQQLTGKAFNGKF